MNKLLTFLAYNIPCIVLAIVCIAAMKYGNIGIAITALVFSGLSTTMPRRDE